MKNAKFLEILALWDPIFGLFIFFNESESSSSEQSNGVCPNKIGRLVLEIWRGAESPPPTPPPPGNVLQKAHQVGGGGDSPPARHISRNKSLILMGQRHSIAINMNFQIHLKQVWKVQKLGLRGQTFSKNSRFLYLSIRIAITSLFFIRFRRNFGISFFIHRSFTYTMRFMKFENHRRFQVGRISGYSCLNFDSKETTYEHGIMSARYSNNRNAM